MIVLYLVLTVLVLLLAVVLLRTAAFRPKAEPTAPCEPVEFDREAAVSRLQQLVRCRTVSEVVTAPDGTPEIDPETGKMKVETVRREGVESFDFRTFKNLWFHVRVNVGASTYFSEIAMVQTLDNLRRDGTLELIDYLERVPDKLIPRKAELVASLKERQEKSAGAGAMPSGPAVGGALSEDKLFAALPTGMQSRYDSLPREAQKALKEVSAVGQ